MGSLDSRNVRNSMDEGEPTDSLESIVLIESMNTMDLGGAPALPSPPVPPPTVEPTPQQKPPTRKPRLVKVRRFLHSRTGRIVSVCLAFVLGILITIVPLLLLGGNRPAVATPVPPTSPDITVQVGSAYVTHLVEDSLSQTGLPGTIENVQVSFAQGDQITVNGDDRLFFPIHFTLILQPIIQNCQTQVRLLHADVADIGVTNFAERFIGQANQQLLVNLNDLPAGFTYCTTSVRTDPQGLFVTYSAKPM